MTRALVPPAPLALRFPAVVLAGCAAVALPVFVGWGGGDDGAGVRLRAAGLLLAALVATAWDDRCRSFLSATPVGEPAIRRGRALLVLTLACVGYAACCWAARDAAVPWAALHLQSAAVALLVAAVVGGLSNDGTRSALVLPIPVLLLAGFLASRLPAELSLIRSQPGDPGWPGERLRWCVVALLSLAVVIALDRDTATRRRPWRKP